MKTMRYQMLICVGMLLCGCAPETISPEVQAERVNMGEQLPQTRENVFLLDKRNLKEAPPSVNSNIREANSLVFAGREGDWERAALDLFAMINAIYTDENIAVAQRANDTQLIGYMTFNSLLVERADRDEHGTYFAECLKLLLLTEPLDVGTMSNIYGYAKNAMTKGQHSAFNNYLQRTLVIAKEISAALVKPEDANYRMLLANSIREAEQHLRLKK